MTAQLDEFKARQRKIWGAGDFATIAQHIGDVGELVVANAGIEPGMQVLDVACGAGNAAIPAARAGAQVTGLDLVPELLAAGRETAQAEGLEVEWVEGDAEQLPFPDGRFDRVLSTFGHMFAPRHQQVADEMVRVCRDGAVIVTATWPPDGLAGQMFRTAGSYMPPPPDYVSPPILWGTEEYVRERFGSAAKSYAFSRQVNTIEWDSVESFADYFIDRFGPLVTAREMLGERFAELRQELLVLWNDANEADDGSARIRQEYLLSVIQL
jgi:ubiquinone/menaquinone biosynthesis C-methylase UbiE